MEVLVLVAVMAAGMLAFRAVLHRDVPSGSSPYDPGTVEYHLSRRERTTAIKVYRERHGGGLKEAKAAVDAMARELFPER